MSGPAPASDTAVTAPVPKPRHPPRSPPHRPHASHGHATCTERRRRQGPYAESKPRASDPAGRANLSSLWRDPSLPP
eukprot:11606143-Heterocapsa_arctica.AAC.1